MTIEKKDIKEKIRYNSPLALLPVVCGVLLNFVFSKLAAEFSLPIYLDNVGTIAAAVTGGYLPGIITGITNNIINYAIDTTSIYYAGISALIAIESVYCWRKGWFRSFLGILRTTLILAFTGGFLGGIISWFLSGPNTEGLGGLLLSWYQTLLGNNLFLGHLVSAFLIDFIDKGLTLMISAVIIMAIPKEIRPMLWLSGWKQTPILDEEEKLVSKSMAEGRSLNTRIAVMLVFATLSIAIVVTGVSSSLFRKYSKDQHLILAQGIAGIVASALDPEKIDQYMEEGDSSAEYREVEKRLYAIRESSPDIEYVYVYKIMKDGCHVVFDLDTDEVKADDPGAVVEFDESYLPYIDDLLAGKKIEPMETDDQFGWLLTAYEPVYNSKGECVCYAAADVAFRDIIQYERDFIIKVVLLFLGFFIFILVLGLWVAKYNMILPINSIAACANDFAKTEDVGNEDEIIRNLKRISELNISTGDEVQDLYESFCKMSSDTVKHMQDIREQTQAIDELQRGLIMAMADMVEGRDSDTGNHVRKTAAYTKIIMDGLRRKGYYTDQLTDKFIEDVVRSAPLHDIGKINVSDVILNKPGKLTDEEFETMKYHTTAGKDMIDQVIETVNGESYLHEARNLAGYHHEKWNGKGYPEGLAGEDIPLSARIMAIADVFDALSSKRCYKDAMPFEKAVNIIREDAGSHFDPKCAEAFLDSLDEVRSVLDYYNELEASGSKVRGNEIKEETLNETVKTEQDS